MIHSLVSLSRDGLLEETSVMHVRLAVPLILRGGRSGLFLLGLSFILDRKGVDPKVDGIPRFLGQSQT